jgi:ATP/maltotriose-dependent transcriptional regulator MalT
VLASTEGMLALVVLAQGRSDEADRLARRAARMTTEGDISPQVLWRRVRAAVLAERGRAAEAERMARDAVAMAELTDCLNDRAAAIEDLGHVLELGGRVDGAREARMAALEVYRRKGTAVSCVRLDAQLTQMTQSSP